jgi:phosphatidate cytidylyltransferase
MGAGATAPLGRSLRIRIATSVGLIGLLALFTYLGRPYLFVLVCAVVLLASFELFDALTRSGHRPVTSFGLLCVLGMLVVAFRQETAGLGAVLALTVLGAFLLALRPRRGASPSSDVAWLVMGVCWIGGGGAGATLIMMLEQGVLLLIAFVLTTASVDVAAYFAGTRLGRHQLAPSISPAKTWEGAIGGALGALAIGTAFGAAIDVLGPLNGLLMGAIVAVTAPVGDLIESMAKREIGIKDSGRLLPGHGGFLDRLDAIIFSAPVVFLFLRVALG